MTEVKNFLKMMDEVYAIFGLDYTMALSTRPEGYLGKPRPLGSTGWAPACTAVCSHGDSAFRALQHLAFHGARICNHTAAATLLPSVLMRLFSCACGLTRCCAAR